MPVVHDIPDPLRPFAVVGVAHGVGRPSNGIDEAQLLAGIGEDAVPSADHGGDARVEGLEGRDVRRDDKESAGSQDRAGREGEADALGEAPAGQVDGPGARVGQLDPFLAVLLGGRVIEQFMDADVPTQEGAGEEQGGGDGPRGSQTGALDHGGRGMQARHAFEGSMFAAIGRARSGGRGARGEGRGAGGGGDRIVLMESALRCGWRLDGWGGCVENKTDA